QRVGRGVVGVVAQGAVAVGRGAPDVEHFGEGGVGAAAAGAGVHRQQRVHRDRFGVDEVRAFGEVAVGGRGAGGADDAAGVGLRYGGGGAARGGVVEGGEAPRVAGEEGQGRHRAGLVLDEAALGVHVEAGAGHRVDVGVAAVVVHAQHHA